MADARAALKALRGLAAETQTFGGDADLLADAAAHLEAALAEVERLTQLSTVTEDLPTMDGWSKNDRSTITS